MTGTFWKKRESGFTLVEIITVVVILSVIMAISVPALKSFSRRNQASMIYRQFTQVLRLAHQWAIFHQDTAVVYLDLDRNTYWYEEGVDDGYKGYEPYKRELAKLPKNYKFISVIYPETEDEVEYGDTQIYFYPNGTATPVDITLQWIPRRQSGKIFKFTINQYSGKVTFEEKSTTRSDDYYD